MTLLVMLLFTAAVITINICGARFGWFYTM
jgi:hypothetical protein